MLQQMQKCMKKWHTKLDLCFVLLFCWGSRASQRSLGAILEAGTKQSFKRSFYSVRFETQFCVMLALKVGGCTFVWSLLLGFFVPSLLGGRWQHFVRPCSGRFAHLLADAAKRNKYSFLKRNNCFVRRWACTFALCLLTFRSLLLGVVQTAFWSWLYRFGFPNFMNKHAETKAARHKKIQEQKLSATSKLENKDCWKLAKQNKIYSSACSHADTSEGTCIFEGSSNKLEDNLKQDIIYI